MIFVESIYMSILKDKKVSFLSLGCKVNAYETEVFRSKFEECGAVTVSFEEGGADIVVINTCSVTNVADRKSRQMLHKAKKLNPNAVIVATGCYVQAVGENEVMISDAEVAAGNERKDRLVETVAEYLKQKYEMLQDTKSSRVLRDTETIKYEVCENEPGKQDNDDRKQDNDDRKQDSDDRNINDAAGDFTNRQQNFQNTASEATDKTRAFIKITDGCNQFCAYCIIPYVRGRVKSRSVNDVVDEVRELSRRGYREIVLTGIHLSSYGTDFNGTSTSYEKAVAEGFGGEYLLDLIDEISSISGIERIRLGSLEPRIITEEFIGRIKDNPKVCPHFHLSLQSGSDSVLKRMKRHYNIGDYENACRIIRNAYDLPSLNTDIIVGFPGETDEEFGETVEFAKKIGFAKIHVFKYSRRKGTLADKMPDQIAEDVKNKRSTRLIETDNENRRNYIGQFVGKRVRILTEQEEIINGRKLMTGLTERYVKVAADTSNTGILRNEFVECRITGVLDEGILTGEVTGDPG